MKKNVFKTALREGGKNYDFRKGLDIIHMKRGEGEGEAVNKTPVCKSELHQSKDKTKQQV